jgi:hypothetical protein
MPNISETSVSDISLSPAWSVMIIFLFVDRSQVAFWARRVSVATWAQSPGARASGSAGPLDRSRTGDLKTQAAKRQRAVVEQQHESNSHDQLGRRNRPTSTADP